MMWRNFRKSMGLPTSNEDGALSSTIKALKEKTEDILGREIKCSAASVPRFSAIYDEDLYDAFEYAGVEYTQINWRTNPRTYLTYETQVALAGHNYLLCWDYSSEYACHGEDLLQNLNPYLLVTYTVSDLIVSRIAAHAHGLYYRDEWAAIDLGMGQESPLRKTDGALYWNKVHDILLQPLQQETSHWYTPSKIIFVGESASEPQFVAFMEA